MRLKRQRVVGCLAVLALSAAACESKAGAAAVVNGRRISESRVAGYVQPGAAPIRGNDGTDTPQKTIVLQTLILGDLLQRAVEASGGPATPTQLAVARRKCLHGSPEADVVDFLVRNGFTAAFEPMWLRSKVELLVLMKRLHASENTDVVAALARLPAKVWVSPRYGAWDERNFVILTGPGVGVPSFVTVAGLPSEPD